jgi:DNA (cytosine-5)-methyltransferase 1
MGGSSTGLQEAGFDIVVAANHWERAIETHSANHPDTEHLQADISQTDPRYLPKTTILWGSPICTELSPAGGRRKRGSQMDLFEQHGHVASAAFERTRVTFWEIIRATEVHRYDAVLIENVVEAAEWELFDIWLNGMATLGYNHQFVSVSAAHIGGDGNDHAPQWRDRLYIVFTRKGIRLPDVEPRPLAWCQHCDTIVRAKQAWKRPGRRIGKYGPQYVYVCERPHEHNIVEPYVMPAAAAIDWTNPGQRIGDRARPLGKATMKRIQLGLDTIGNPALIGAGGNTWDSASGAKNAYVRAWPLDTSPTPAQVTAIQNGVATTEPFLTMLRRNGKPVPVGQPAPTFSAGGFHHGLTVPPGAFISAHHGGYATGDPSMNKAVSEPMRTQTAQINKSLVIPYRKGAKPYRVTDSALSTMATRDQHGVLQAAVDVDDCYFRMLTPREAANAQRFPREYIIRGNQGEQQMQAGNAVAVNVARWLGAQVAKVLDGGAS